MKHHKLLIALLSISATALMLTNSQAAPLFTTTAYTTLANDGSYGSTGHAINGSPNSHSVAESFVPTVSGDLAAIDLGIIWINSSQDTFNITIYSDAGGINTSSILASSPSLTTFYQLFTTTTGLTTWNYTGSPLLLNAGTTYWLGVSAVSLTGQLGWNSASPNNPNWISYTSLNGGAYSSNGGGSGVAFDVQVSAVPEPSTYALLGLGALAMVIARRRMASR